MAATNPDSKRPRLNSWESTSSSSLLPPHEFQTHPPHPPSHPQHSSPYASLSTGPRYWGGEMKTPPHSIQHTLSHQRSHSVPSQPPGVGGKNVSLHHTQQSHPGQSANSHALGLGASRANSPRATHVQQTPLQMPSGPNSNPNPGYQAFQSQHQLQKPQPGIDGSSSTSPPSSLVPLMRTVIDQQQVQQLRPLSVSGHSSASGNHPQYPGDSFYIQHGLPQGSGDARGSLGVDTISPGSTATLAPGPSPIMTSGGFSGGSGLMNQHMSGPSPVGGQHMNGASSPVTTPTSTGGMMANGLQGMGVTTYPPRRKAIRAAQVRFFSFFLPGTFVPRSCNVSILGCSCTRDMKIWWWLRLGTAAWQPVVVFE